MCRFKWAAPFEKTKTFLSVSQVDAFALCGFCFFSVEEEARELALA